MILEEYIDDEITDKKEFKKQLTWLERNYQDLYKDDIVNKYKAIISHKEELEKHKEVCAVYRAEHSEKLKEKFNCECGGKYTYQHKSCHIKTKFHQDYLNRPPPQQSTPDTQ
jgi:site-specific DNA-adenine methylase